MPRRMEVCEREREREREWDRQKLNCAQQRHRQFAHAYKYSLKYFDCNGIALGLCVQCMCTLRISMYARTTERLGCCIASFTFIFNHIAFYSLTISPVLFYFLPICQCSVHSPPWSLSTLFRYVFVCMCVALYSFHCHHFIYSKILAP